MYHPKAIPTKIHQLVIHCIKIIISKAELLDVSPVVKFKHYTEFFDWRKQINIK